MRFIVLGLVFIMAVASCGQESTNESSNDSLQGRWFLNSVNGADVTEVVNLQTGGPLVLDIDGTKFETFDGCAGIRGTFAQDGDEFSLGEVTIQDIGCPGPRVPVDRSIDAAESAEASDGQLILKNADGAVVLAASRERAP